MAPVCRIQQQDPVLHDQSHQEDHAHEAGDVEGKKAEMLVNFKTKKQNALAEINSIGANLNTEKTAFETEIKGLKERIDNGKKYVETLKTEINTLEVSIETECSHSQGCGKGGGRWRVPVSDGAY